MRINPYFEINKIRYEIKPTRFLIAEYEKIGDSQNISKEDKVNAVKLQNMANQLKGLAEKLNELKETYYADMTNKQAKAQYKACKEEYDEAFEELATFEIESGSTNKLQKETINVLERIAILGLAEQYFDNDADKANDVWCSWVDTVSKDTATEWLVEMSNNLFGADEEDESSFLAQVRAKKEERANNKRNGLARK